MRLVLKLHALCFALCGAGSPYERKQIARIQQQLADLDLKEAEFKRNAAVSAMKYQQACQELGIAVWSSQQSLPPVCSELLGSLR